MTRILSLETSGDFASAALWADGTVTLNLFKEKNRHTESLLSLVDEVLKRSNLTVSDMDAVAFGAAQGLAWAIGKPTVAVGNLAAAAYAQMQKDPSVNRITVVNDARMHECYTGTYERGEDGTPAAVREAELVKPETLASYLTDVGAQAVTGTALSAYADEIRFRADLGRRHRALGCGDVCQGRDDRPASGRAPLRAQPRGSDD